MPDSNLLEGTTRALGAARDIGAVRAAISAWAPRFHDALQEDVQAGPRPDLGMDIGLIPGRGALVAPRGDRFFVGLGRVANRAERRFTLAHELAHVVLDAADREALGLDSETEEDLCELFARRALAPPALVSRYLGREGTPTELADIDRFAARFRISLRASLVVLNEVFPASAPVAFVAASWRAHPRGDGVLGMRIDVSAADEQRFFLPTHCRLGTLGFRQLEAWSLVGEVGTEGSGRDAEVEVKSWRRGVAAWVGESDWMAQRHLAPGSRPEADKRGVLCRLDVGSLSPRRSRRRRHGPARTSARVAEIPGQMAL